MECAKTNEKETSKKCSFVSKMDSHLGVPEHESCAKRIKLDVIESDISELCDENVLKSFSTLVTAPITTPEVTLLDNETESQLNLQSLETSTENITQKCQTTPTSIQEIPNTYLEGTENCFPTPSTSTSTEILDISQDSTENNTDDEDNASTISNLSGLSAMSGQDWKPMAGRMAWIQKQMQNRVDPRTVLNDLGVDLDQVPAYVDGITLWKLIINLLTEPPRRQRLRHVNTLDDIVRLLKGAQNIIVLTGAGVSVSCGIPDFRSKDGIYSRLAIDFPDLPDPQAMFDISYFNQDPRPFFKFARDIYPGKFEPSPCHKFIKLLEKHKKLLRNYTQNIDTLEKVAEIDNVIECHGSFATASCTKCKHKVTAQSIRDTVLEQKIPVCEMCHQNQHDPIAAKDFQNIEDLKNLVASGIMKPDIVFFGEGLPETFHDAMAHDKNKCDLLIVIGSSLKVRPVALIPSSLPTHVPQILINRESLPHCRFDVELLGDCDIIVNYLCHLLGSSWQEGIYNPEILKEAESLLPLDESDLDSISEIEISKNSININNKNAENTSTVYSNFNQCKCNSSSLSESEACFCSENSSTQMSNATESDNDVKFSKERHMSIDSARDSGIGDNSNFTDLETKFDDTSDENCDDKNVVPSCSTSPNSNCFNMTESTADLRGFWQPKIKKNLADRLPQNSFLRMKYHSRYIFPGAETYYDPDDKFSNSEDSESSEDSDTELDLPVRVTDEVTNS